MRKVLALAALALAVLVAAVPAAATQREPTGARINVLGGFPTTFPAGAPFHIRHGWNIVPDTSDYDAIGKWTFSLDVDGVPRREDFVLRFTVTSEESGLPFDFLVRLWVHNFPSGMNGTHTFTGHWFGPCQSAVDSGFPVGPCPNPTQVVEANSRSLTVTFTP